MQNSELETNAGKPEDVKGVNVFKYGRWGKEKYLRCVLFRDSYVYLVQPKILVHFGVLQ